MAQERDNHYVNNGKFLKELADYKKALKMAKREKTPLPRIPEYVGEFFKLIAERYATRPEYSGYSYKDMMISDGYFTCLQYFDRYDAKKAPPGGPLTYFTCVIMRAFWRRIEIEHKQQYTKYKILNSTSLLVDLVEEINPDLSDDDVSELHQNVAIYDNINDFMTRFEAKVAAKRARAKESKGAKTKKGLTKKPK